MPKYYIPNGDEDEREFVVETLEDGRYEVVTPEGEKRVVDAFEPEPGRLHVITDQHSFDTDVRPNDDGYMVQLRGEAEHFDVLNERERRMRIAGAGARGGLSPDLQSPMAGKVVAVECEEGQSVEVGDTVIVVEAMKMENDLKAHREGTVSNVHVSAGDAVEIGDVLVTIEEA